MAETHPLHGFLKDRRGRYHFDRLYSGCHVEIGNKIFARRVRGAFRQWKNETGSPLEMRVTGLIDDGSRCYWLMIFEEGAGNDRI